MDASHSTHRQCRERLKTHNQETEAPGPTRFYNKTTMAEGEGRQLSALERAEAASLETQGLVDKALARQKWRASVGLAAPDSPSSVLHQEPQKGCSADKDGGCGTACGTGCGAGCGAVHQSTPPSPTTGLCEFFGSVCRALVEPPGFDGEEMLKFCQSWVVIGDCRAATAVVAALQKAGKRVSSFNPRVGGRNPLSPPNAIVDVIALVDTKSAEGLGLMEQAAAAGVRNVWIQLGAASSAELETYCRKQGLSVHQVCEHAV